MPGPGMQAGVPGVPGGPAQAVDGYTHQENVDYAVEYGRQIASHVNVRPPAPASCRSGPAVSFLCPFLHPTTIPPLSSQELVKLISGAVADSHRAELAAVARERDAVR